MATSNISDAEWREHKPTIIHLYKAKNLTLDLLMSEMSSSHGFSATKSQYTTKFKAWKLQKNSKSEFYKGIGGALKRRHLEVSDANVYSIEGQIPPKKLKKELQRYTAQGDQPANDASAPATPKGITIQPIIEHLPSIQHSIPRNLTISLPWHSFVDSWSLVTFNSPTPSPAILPAASPIQIYSPGWASVVSQPYADPVLPGCMDPFPQPYDDGLFPDMLSFSPVPWEQFEPPPPTGTVSNNDASKDNNALDLAFPQNKVIQCFGSRAARVGNDDRKTLEKHLRKFLVERQPEETQRAVQDLMDPNSTASMRILTSYMALLFSNDLVMDDEDRTFLARAKELHQLGNLKPLFAQRSPSARAVAARLLHAAIQSDATNFLNQALKSGADLESPSTGEGSLTLLQNALKAGKDEAARILIDAGANVNAGDSATHSEIACKYSAYHLKSFTCGCEIRGSNSPMALAAGNPTCVNLIPKLVGKSAVIPERNPVLFHAIRVGASVTTLTSLIRAGADINQHAIAENEEGSPLCAAAERINLQVVKLLLDAGASPDGCLKQEHSRVFRNHGWDQDRFKSPLLRALSARIGRSHQEDETYDVVRLLLESGANPNISVLDIIFGQHNWSSAGISRYCRIDRRYLERYLTYPLQAAAVYDDIELVRLLLQHKASVNSAHGSPALALAVSKANVEMVRLLLSHGADPNGLGSHHCCRSALEEAVEQENLELIDLLLESGADVNKCSAPYGGRTPLQRAAENGKKRVIAHLLKHGASMLSPPASTKGTSVLQGFVRNRLHEYVLKALEAGANPDGDSGNGSTLLAAAVISNDTVSLGLLLGAGAQIHHYTYLQFSEKMLEDINASTYDYLDQKNLSPIQWAALSGHMEVARMLCNAGANVNQVASQPRGGMALHLAIHRDNIAMARFLIAQEAEVNAYSTDDTPLLVAIRCEHESIVKFVRLLLRHGADPNQPGFSNTRNPIPSSPLDLACFFKSKSAIQELLRAGADASKGCPLGNIYKDFDPELYEPGDVREMVEILLKYGANVNKRDYDDDTPLQHAITAEEFDGAYRLIEAGACINDPPSKSERGRTALQAAVSVGDVDMVEHLLLKGADVNAPAAVVDGVTALQAAAINGYLGIAHILLEHGADINAKAGIENGRTAIEGAAEFGRIDMVKFLLDNYQGPQSIPQIRDEAYKAAEKGKQWYVMELLTAYKHPSEAWH